MIDISGVKIFPIGDSAATVEFGTDISVELNDLAIGLAGHFEKLPFPGLIEAVSAYSSTSLFYEIESVRSAFPGHDTAFDAVRSLVKEALQTVGTESLPDTKTIEVPISFKQADAPDLDELALSKRLAPAEVIDIFLSRRYRVYMIGFLPGFAYMGKVDERIATPRRLTPRQNVPKGSIGIAGVQTGIYPIDSPGGWQIIGRTDIELFDPTDRTTPCLLKPGDQVRFIKG